MGESSMLVVKMFGDFTVEYDGVYVVPAHSRESKVILFLQYLLAHRDRAIPQEELAEVILGDDDSNNPVNTIKNIAYRARKLFLDSGLPAKEYICQHRGTYGFSSTIPCEIDAEWFCSLLVAAKAADNDEARLDYLRRAVISYTGDYLPRSIGQTWVAPLTVKYQDMYCEAIVDLCMLLLDKEEYTATLQVTEKAVTLYPYLEKFRVVRLICLQKLGRIRELMAEYDATCAILYDELGVMPSEELNAVYRSATADVEHMADSVDQVLAQIIETDTELGAYYCNYQVFLMTSRFACRHAERQGQSAFMALCTFRGEWDDYLSPDQIKNAALAFHKAMSVAVRRCDIYSRYSPQQFLLLMTGLNGENCNLVLRRIEMHFNKYNHDRSVKLRCGKVSAIMPPPSKKTELSW